jgi:hypothetical protein
MEWGGKGEGEVSLQATWDQGGRGSHHAKRRGFQLSRRDSGKRGVVKGNQQGELARGIYKGLRHGLVSSICTYVSRYCVNVATKRIVFRL